MQDIFADISANLTDFLIYAATILAALIGLFKCVLPVRRAAHRLRRAVRLLETSAGEGGHPVWQDVLFLGKEMQGSWRRFLNNAEQLDARGLNCNVEDYVNDDTVIYSVGHAQLAEVIPSLLTSLGILGTFIGLMRGLGGLDVSDAAKTMESIPQMIGGMTFAFTTSIVGIACSLAFNMLNRMAYGSAVRAIDEFNDAFTDIVMQKPLDDSVQMICQQEDRTALLRHLSSDMSARVSDGISASMEKSLAPVAQGMNRFIMGQTQAQLDGLNQIVQQFIAQMNRALGGQFAQLGQTLSTVNQAQTVSQDALERTLTAADQILSGLNQVQDVTERVMRRFESYVQTLEQSQREGDDFLAHGSQVLSGMLSAAQEQTDLLSSIQASQKKLQSAMRDYADWSGRVFSAAEEQSNGLMTAGGKIAAQMNESSARLSESYASFVEQLTGGFAKSMGIFDENIHSVLSALSQRLEDIRTLAASAPEQAAKYRQETEGCITALSQLQRALADLTALVHAKNAAEEK